MTGVFNRLITRIFPPVPEEIRDDVAILRANRIETLTPMLFLMHNRGRRMSPRRARRMIVEAGWLSGITGLMCSTWTVTNWLAAPAATHSYYAMIMAMGSLATAYCLSSIRFATFVNLGVGLGPVALLMLTSGNPPEIAAGTSLVIATLFLLRMVLQQHGQVIDLLELQRQMRQLAHTDPLTGLANRREFDLRIEEEIGKADETSPFAIALLDLNGFKPVNDQHGHAIGDMLLCEIAERLRRTCGQHGVVARQGGDEFAILAPAGSPLLETSLADHILAALAAPYRIDGRPIRVGASIGTANFPEHGMTARKLFEIADTALYAAKATDRSQTSSVESIGWVA